METSFILNPGSSMLAPCDFCNLKLAVLYCKADSAKLCLFCDQQVHSANTLSLRHLRSQICDNCRAEPVSVRCCTENLMLCQDCDWDSHYNSSVSSLHERSPVEGFSGCPSVIELATHFDIKGDDLKNLGCGFDVCNPKMLNLEELTVQTQSCYVFMSNEKCKQEVYEQLVEMGKRDLVRFNGDGADLVPGTPSSICDLMWDWDPSCPAAQLQNLSSQTVSSHTPTTEESNNTLIIGPPSECRSVEFETWESTELFHVMHHSILNGSETANDGKANVDMEMLAQNRGNAMLRYKEKKKNRSYAKQIRYESRKARADTRKRKKGRFVKASETSDVEM